MLHRLRHCSRCTRQDSRHLLNAAQVEALFQSAGEACTDLGPSKNVELEDGLYEVVGRS